MFAKVRRNLPDFLNVPWSLRDLLLFVLGWFGIQIAIVFALAILSPYIPELAQFMKLAEDGDVTASFMFTLLDAAVGIGLVWLYLSHYKRGWKEVGWRRFDVLQAAKYLLAILVIFVASVQVVLIVVGILVPGFNPDQEQTNEFTKAVGTGAHNSLVLIALVLLPPVLEETIFRGFLFPALAKRAGLIWGAVWSSAIFGLAHWQANISIYTFLLGLLLCFMYVRLRSIVPGIILHMLNNYLALLSIGLNK